MAKQRMAGQAIQGVPEGLDPKLVKQAGRGKKWGEQDQKRYDTLSGDRIGGKGAKEIRQGGGSLDERIGKLEGMKADGVEFGGNAQRHLDSMNQRRDKLDARRAAKQKANDSRAPGAPDNPNVNVQPIQPPQQGQMPPGTQVDNSVDNTFGVGGDLNQNVGKKGDTNTTIGDNNTIGHGATIGGDYSVTIGGNSAGNGQQGSGTGNVQGGMNNMQLAASYNALNENAYHRSSAQLNGAGRAAQASAAANEITGAQDRVANLYNATGMDQNYWRNKSNAQSNFYLGDIFKEGFGGYDWTMPDAPNKIEDNTQEIYEDAKKEMKDV